MKLSTKCRYGLRALVDLALSSSAQPEPLYRIAERQGLSLKYLEQEFSTLRKAGFVRSIKGSQGGYKMARSAADIRIADVIRHLEGDLLLVDEPADLGSMTPIRQCLYGILWNPLNRRIEETLLTLTLADLIESWQSGHKDDPMYYI